jgi:hypothetical protein
MALSLWMLLIVSAIIAADNHKEASVIDGSGRVIVAGRRYVILTQEHWWRDAVVLFTPYVAALIAAIVLFWYCSKRLRSISPVEPQ